MVFASVSQSLLADGDLVRVGSLELKVSVTAEPKLETEGRHFEAVARR
jgi:hypothetical protein